MKIFCRKNRKYIIDGIVIAAVTLFTLFYLIKGGYFTAEKLSVIDGITGVATHFILKKYKIEGQITRAREEIKRQIVQA